MKLGNALSIFLFTPPKNNHLKPSSPSFTIRSYSFHDRRLGFVTQTYKDICFLSYSLAYEADGVVANPHLFDAHVVRFPNSDREKILKSSFVLWYTTIGSPFSSTIFELSRRKFPFLLDFSTPSSKFVVDMELVESVEVIAALLPPSACRAGRFSINSISCTSSEYC